MQSSPSHSLWKPNFCVQMPIIPQPSSRMIPIATALNMVFVERPKRFWMCQKAKMPTACAAMPTMRRYVSVRVL